MSALSLPQHPHCLQISGLLQPSVWRHCLCHRRDTQSAALLSRDSPSREEQTDKRAHFNNCHGGWVWRKPFPSLWEHVGVTKIILDQKRAEWCLPSRPTVSSPFPFCTLGSWAVWSHGSQHRRSGGGRRTVWGYLCPGWRVLASPRLEAVYRLDQCRGCYKSQSGITGDKLCADTHCCSFTT